jgi:hypothetical protein
MGRPIGRRIKQVFEVVEKFGPCSAAQVHAHIPDIQIENVHKYCSRAVGLRLLSVDRQRRPKLYRVVDKSVVNDQPEPAKAPEIHHLQGVWR